MPPLRAQPDHNSTIRAIVDFDLLRVSESPWFNLSFDFMHTDELGELPREESSLVGCEIAAQPQMKPRVREFSHRGTKARSKCTLLPV